MLVQESGFFFDLVVADHPLLLLASRDLRGWDYTLDAMDMPPVLRGVSLCVVVKEHSKHELTLDLGKEVNEIQQLALSESSLLVPVVTAYVG